MVRLWVVGWGGLKVVWVVERKGLKVFVGDWVGTVGLWVVGWRTLRVLWVIGWVWVGFLELTKLWLDFLKGL